MKHHISPRVGIIIWMLSCGIEREQIMDDLEITTSAVTHFLKSRLTSQQIAEYFVSKGCPAKYFHNGRVKK